MSGRLPSSRFATIYDSLPADAQRALVEKHLIPLLNFVDKGRSKKALTQAASLRKRHSGIPVLDLKAKRVEVNALLDELHRDAKRSFVKDRSHKKELLNETVDSLTDWLNDIWSVVYEYNVDFVHAHKCLLFVAGTLDHLGGGRSSCRCAFTSLPINVTLKRKSGRRIKSFDIIGAHNLEEILHFIWRDLFLSMLATGNQHQIAKIPDMLDDIEDLLGWMALERVLYGGRKCPHDFDLESDEEDDSEYDTEVEDDDDDSDFLDDDMLAGPQYSRHWSYRVSSQMGQLRQQVHAAMMAVFKKAPSQQLYSALCAVSPDPDLTETALLKHLDSIAVGSSDTFSAALDIYSFEGNAEAIMSLLRTHKHLLRPRDAPSLQSAVTVIATHSPYHAHALGIVEKELLDTARVLRTALLVSFSQLELAVNKDELQQILKLRQGAPGRQDRIEAWVDAVSTPGMNAPNPMAFAAIMMGLPLMPGMDPSEEADPLGYLDLDPNDPDLEDLREEFRPRLKQRLEGWSEVALLLKAGPVILQKVYREVVELMPFLRANDVVEEMVGRLADKPSKHYVCDGLDALMQFVKQQRKRASNARSLQRRRDALRPTGSAATAGATVGTSTAAVGSSSSSSATGSFPPTHPTPSGLPAAAYHLHIPFSGPSRLGTGGMEDVD